MRAVSAVPPLRAPAGEVVLSRQSEVLHTPLMPGQVNYYTVVGRPAGPGRGRAGARSSSACGWVGGHLNTLPVGGVPFGAAHPEAANLTGSGRGCQWGGGSPPGRGGGHAHQPASVIPWTLGQLLGREGDSLTPELLGSTAVNLWSSTAGGARRSSTYTLTIPIKYLYPYNGCSV